MKAALVLESDTDPRFPYGQTAAALDHALDNIGWEPGDTTPSP